MKRPKRRVASRTRRSDNAKRKLMSNPEPADLVLLAGIVRYAGSSKHKLQPVRFGLLPYRSAGDDRTMCDRDAKFDIVDMATIPALFLRGAWAGLVAADHRIWWSVSDTGWIFEARLSNTVQHEYHGYPVLPTDPFAESVYRRFVRWAADHGTPADNQAARNCRELYRFRP